MYFTISLWLLKTDHPEQWQVLTDYKEREHPIMFIWSQVIEQLIFSIERWSHSVAIPTLSFQVKGNGDDEFACDESCQCPRK